MTVSTRYRFILFVASISQIRLAIAQPVLACPTCNNTNGNYTSNSTFSKNLNSLLNIISSNTQINNGFYNISVGQNPDTVYGMAVCRADHSPSDCQRYFSDSTKLLIADCPVQKEAIGYYYGASMLRYSDRPIFRGMENSPNCTVMQSPQNIPDTDLRKFKQSLGNLLEGLNVKTSDGNSSYKFSSGEEEISESLKVYALSQCNPYLSSSECSDCLEGVTSQLEHCCSTFNGAGTYGPICGVEFANYPLINTAFNSSLQPIQPASANSGDRQVKPGNRSGSAYKTWIIVVGVVSVMLISTLVFVLSRRNMRKKVEQEDGNGQMKLVESLELDFSSIQLATDNFSDARRLDNNTGTAMYKGKLPDGQEIVVKRLDKGGRDGELEFDNEVLLSANFQHKNLVKLLGFCIERDLRILVYEFLPNGSLHDLLIDPVKRSNLDWQTRYHIISGLARGLLYLHEDSHVRVIHRDLKPNNILLGTQMDSKISNFKTASLVHTDQTRGYTRFVGTYGYMPPEYVKHGHSSIKSDIFSYGVILLEIITGHRVSEFSGEEAEERLLTYVWRKWSAGSASDVVDKALPNIERHVHEVKRCVKIGLLCVQEDPRLRPTMSTVVLMLNSDSVAIADPLKPAQVILNNLDHQHSDSQTTQSSHEASLNEASISYLEPR